MKRFAIILSVLLIFLLFSCSSTKNRAASTEVLAAAEETGESVVISQVQFTEVKGVPVTLTTGKNASNGLDYGIWQPYSSDLNNITPWISDASAVSKADGTLRFYFMAGEGTEIEGVGQKIGDSCVAVFPDGTTMMIDACQNQGSGFRGQLLLNLERMGIRKLDYIVFTHPHSDHYACFTSENGIADNVEVGLVYINGCESSGTDKIIQTCDAHSIPYAFLTEGDALDIAGVHIDIYNPDKDTIGKELSATRELNDSSITMKFTYGERTALFTGDLYDSGMQTVSDKYADLLKADILKIPHHGHSETSLCSTFAELVDPSVAVVSSGVAMNSSVYEMYASTGAMVLCDYNEGYIVISTDGKNIDIRTSRTRESSHYLKYDTQNWYSDVEIASFKGTTVPADAKWTEVSTVDELKAAADKGCTFIRLANDLELTGYTAHKRLKIDLSKVAVLDLGGHTIGNVISQTGEIYSNIQSSMSSLVLYGNNFTIMNGSISHFYTKGGYALQIGMDGDTKASDNTGIRLENITIPNGGLYITGSSVVLQDCFFQMAEGTTQQLSTIYISDSILTMLSGTYNGYDCSLGRFMKINRGTLYVKNGVQYNGTLTYAVDNDSYFFPQKSQLEI